MDRTIEKQTVIPKRWASLSRVLKIPAHLHTAQKLCQRDTTHYKHRRRERQKKTAGIPDSVIIFKDLNVSRKSLHTGSPWSPQCCSVRFLSESNVWQTCNTKRKAFNIKKENCSHICRLITLFQDLHSWGQKRPSESRKEGGLARAWNRVWFMMRWQLSENTREIIIENHKESRVSALYIFLLSSNNRSAI